MLQTLHALSSKHCARLVQCRQVRCRQPNMRYSRYSNLMLQVLHPNITSSGATAQRLQPEDTPAHRPHTEAAQNNSRLRLDQLNP